jgi:hypothetical protein
VRYKRNMRVTVGQASAHSLRRMPPIPRGKVTVYRFRSLSAGLVAPQRMWGTPEAIATLSDCELIPGTGRLVHRKLLEEGFFFEQVNSSYIAIEEDVSSSADSPS